MIVVLGNKVGNEYFEGVQVSGKKLRNCISAMAENLEKTSDELLQNEDFFFTNDENVFYYLHEEMKSDVIFKENIDEE